MSEQMTVPNALYVWSCLEQARNKKSPYGKDVTEVYVQNLLPDNYNPAIGKTLWVQASKTLYSITKTFCDSTNTKAFINGREIGEWMNECPILDRCEVRIEAQQHVRNKKAKKRVVRKIRR